MSCELLPGHRPSMGTGCGIGIGGAAFLLTWNDTDQSPSADCNSDPSPASGPSYPPGSSTRWGLAPADAVSSPQQVSITKYPSPRNITDPCSLEKAKSFPEVPEAWREILPSPVLSQTSEGDEGGHDNNHFHLSA